MAAVLLGSGGYTHMLYHLAHQFKGSHAHLRFSFPLLWDLVELMFRGRRARLGWRYNGCLFLTSYFYLTVRFGSLFRQK